MSKRYTPEEKAAALAALEENGGCTALTSLKLGIPQRTLQAWKRAATPPEELLRRLQEKNRAPQQAPLQIPIPKHLLMDDPEFEAILRRDAERADTILDDVLKQLLESVRVLAGRITTNFDHVPPTTQIMALSRLIDRILKLEARQPRIEQPHAIIIRYQDDDGSFHKTPYWMRSADDEDADEEDGHDSVASLRERW